MAKFDLVITTYSMVARLEWLAKSDWSWVVREEAQAIKNPGIAPELPAKTEMRTFCELAKLLYSYLDEVTRDIISRAVHGDLSEAMENPHVTGCVGSLTCSRCGVA